MPKAMRALLTAAAGAAILAACALEPRSCPPAPPPAARVAFERAGWSELPGWQRDALEQSWPAFRASCGALAHRAAFAIACAAAQALSPASTVEVRAFFERYFDAYRIVSETGRHREASGLITGYFEPQLDGDRSPTAEFDTPLYAPPPDLLTIDLGALYPELRGKRLRGRLEGNRVVPYFSRAQLDRDPALRGREIVWVHDALGAFFLEVQGSGRVRLPSGETIRLQYADQNGYPYRSIGRYLIEHGELAAGQATLPRIRAWALAHRKRLPELLDANPSVVFFEEAPLGDPTLGPKGALGVPLTPERSIAIDPAFIPLGAPVFIATTFPGSDVALERLVMAQDAGGAIRGPVRADFFWGTGSAAAREAGTMRELGELWLLWPKGSLPHAQ